MAEYVRKEIISMSKEEIALELTKLSYKDAVHRAGADGKYDIEKIVTELYNYILNNVNHSEPSK